MTGDVGALGFWLMVGIILAAGTVTEGLKARDKERERQATLRALLGRDEKAVCGSSGADHHQEATTATRGSANYVARC